MEGSFGCGMGEGARDERYGALKELKKNPVLLEGG